MFCSNINCYYINKIVIGKKYGRVWDVNIKLVIGINKIIIKFNKWIYIDIYNVYVDKIFK